MKLVSSIGRHEGDNKDEDSESEIEYTSDLDWINLNFNAIH